MTDVNDNSPVFKNTDKLVIPGDISLNLPVMKFLVFDKDDGKKRKMIAIMETTAKMKTTTKMKNTSKMKIASKIMISFRDTCLHL